MGVNGMRNLHENNLPDVSDEEAQRLNGKIYVVLPPLSEGNQYELVQLASGRTAVVFKKENEENTGSSQETEREKFERRYHS